MGKSNFKFLIEGTCTAFEHKLRTFHKEGIISTKEEDKITLYDESKGYILTFVKENDKFVITTSKNDFRYTIFKGEKGKTTVEFEGPVNALWQQYLLPKINYAKGSLQGKYEEDDTYLSIDAYMQRRNETIGDNNQQDKLGWKINDIFKNDIPFLQKAHRSMEKHLN